MSAYPGDYGATALSAEATPKLRHSFLGNVTHFGFSRATCFFRPEYRAMGWGLMGGIQIPLAVRQRILKNTGKKEPAAYKKIKRANAGNC